MEELLECIQKYKDTHQNDTSVFHVGKAFIATLANIQDKAEYIDRHLLALYRIHDALSDTDIRSLCDKIFAALDVKNPVRLFDKIAKRLYDRLVRDLHMDDDSLEMKCIKYLIYDKIYGHLNQSNTKHIIEFHQVKQEYQEKYDSTIHVGLDENISMLEIHKITQDSQ